MAPTTVTAAPVRAAKPWYKILYIQVLIAIVLGALVGWKFHDFATSEWVKALGDGFIKLIKMVIAPIIFCTVVSGISHIQDARKVGRIGIKALVYFEVVSTFALVIGLLVGNLIRPGAGFGGAMANADKVASFRQAGGRAKERRFRPAHHSGHGGRCVCEWRDPAGSAVFDPVRLFADGARRARPHGCAPSLTMRRKACSA